MRNILLLKLLLSLDENKYYSAKELMEVYNNFYGQNYYISSIVTFRKILNEFVEFDFFIVQVVISNTFMYKVSKDKIRDYFSQ